jgi:RHS repeat-associated protein
LGEPAAITLAEPTAISLAEPRAISYADPSQVGRVRSDATVAGYRYDAWGGFRGVGTPTGAEASLAYAGQHWDEDLGLSYAQQRWYEPGTGRFLSEDPVGWNAERLSQPTRGHAFGYAAGNPLLFTDPEGLDVGQPESTSKRAQEDMAYEAARNEWSKDEGNWLTGCLAAEADNWRHIDSAAFSARSKSPAWLAGYMKCQGRPVADAWHDSDIGKTTREFWTATPGRSQTMGCFIGGVNAITPVGGGDVNDLPASMQQSAGMCQFAVGGATLGVMLVEQGPGALQKLKDPCKALKSEPALAAATADGRTVAVAGKEVSAAESVPTNFKATGRSGRSGGEPIGAEPPAVPPEKVVPSLRPEKAAPGRHPFEGIPRELHPAVFDIITDLQAARAGDAAAAARLASRSQHTLTGNLKGWTSLDIAGRQNPLRFLFKEESGGLKWMVRDTHR